MGKAVRGSMRDFYILSEAHLRHGEFMELFSRRVSADWACKCTIIKVQTFPRIELKNPGTVEKHSTNEPY